MEAELFTILNAQVHGLAWHLTLAPTAVLVALSVDIDETFAAERIVEELLDGVEGIILLFLHAGIEVKKSQARLQGDDFAEGVRRK